MEEEKVPVEEVKEEKPAKEESKETDTKDTSTPGGDSVEKEEPEVAAAAEQTTKGDEDGDKK